MKTVLVIDDHELIFDGLKAHLGGRAELLYAGGLGAARTLLGTARIDAVVLDIRIGAEDGFELLEEYGPALPVFVLSMHRSPSHIDRAKALGAQGYFLKDENLTELFNSLLAETAGRFRIPLSMETLKIAETGLQKRFKDLTPREQQIFILIGEGYNYKEIAHRLRISPKTVNVHRENIMSKMEASSLPEMVKIAIQLGFVGIAHSQ